MNQVAGPLKLWRSLVGSHAFGMNHAGSDYDFFDCYVVDSRDILSGHVHIGGDTGGCHVSQFVYEGVKADVQSHELWRWVDGARNENPNYMIGLFSPFADDPDGLLRDLRSIVDAHRSLAIVAPTLGMGRSNLKKFASHIESGDDRRALKNLRTSIRFIWFAKRFIDGVRAEHLLADMRDVRNIPDDELLTRLKLEMELLEEMAERSSLPPRADPLPFEQFTLVIRLKVLSGEI
jgi:predicted nucleotidyltransferase